jgi:hypothetical protein
MTRLEADIRTRHPIPPRPATSKELSAKAVAQNYKVKESLFTTMVTDMKGTSKSPTTGHWALDRRTHNDWRDNKKHIARDWQKFAIAAFIEEKLVAEYRPKLLSNSGAAYTLRNKLKTMMASQAKRTIVIENNTNRKGRFWQFPDGLTTDPTVRKDIIEIDEAIVELADNVTATKTASSTKSAIAAIRRLPNAILMPKSKNLNPVIESLVTELEKVSPDTRSL